MILYDYKRAPNARRVRIFLAEKKINIEIKNVDLMKQENIQDDFLKINPSGTVPFLQIKEDEGLTESIAICRYFEEKFPEPAMMGSNPLEKAKIEMWQRLVEFNGIFPAGESFRNKLEGFKDRAIAGPNKIKQIPELVVRGEILLNHFFKRMDLHLSKSNYVGSNNFSIADISAYIAIDFASWIKVIPDENHVYLNKWLEKVKLRDSINA